MFYGQFFFKWITLPQAPRAIKNPFWKTLPQKAVVIMHQCIHFTHFHPNPIF